LFAGAANAQRSSDRQVRDIVRSLATKIDDFRYTLDYQLRSSSTRRVDSGGVLNDLITLDRKVSDFQLNLDQHRENKDDVNAIIEASKPINSFLAANPQNQHIQTEWNDVKTFIARLSSNYSVIPRWDTTTSSYPSGSGTYRSAPTDTGTTDSPLVGTYRIDRARSERVDQVLKDSDVDKSRVQELTEKLAAPDQLAIDIRGDQVTLASSKAPAVTFVADGRDKVEYGAGGRTYRTRATFHGEELSVSSLGGDNDYTVTFASQDGGRTLKVTRRITTDYLSHTMFADSIYTRTDTVARLGIDKIKQPVAQADTGKEDASEPVQVDNDDNSANQPAPQTVGSQPTQTDNNTDNRNQPTTQTDSDSDDKGYSDNDSNTRTSGNSNNQPTSVPGRSGQFVVPNGVVLTGMLNTTVDTKMSQNSDRFKMTVQSPNEFRGAVIEGHLTGVGRSGRVSGRSNVTLTFETITLRDGQTYDFAGFLQGIKDHNGKVVKVDSEGTIKGDSQTKETAKRGGLGAGIGAVIGVIAGGGSGAAIGSIIGGSVGAGSVIVQGRDDVRLMPGSMITVQASSPIR